MIEIAYIIEDLFDTSETDQWEACLDYCLLVYAGGITAYADNQNAPTIIVREVSILGNDAVLRSIQRLMIDGDIEHIPNTERIEFIRTTYKSS
ncbi:MAG: hypothetical protein Q8R26_01565 [bacterium]|nr:hypothetical protein [bacterium]